MMCSTVSQYLKIKGIFVLDNVEIKISKIHETKGMGVISLCKGSEEFETLISKLGIQQTNQRTTALIVVSGLIKEKIFKNALTHDNKPEYPDNPDSLALETVFASIGIEILDYNIEANQITVMAYLNGLALA